MRDASLMRTTLNLDDDVLEAAKLRAAQDGRTLGAVVSDMLRQAAEPPPESARGRTRNGLPLFPVAKGARPVTPDVVRKLLDDTP
jgi:hypothetical protein